MFLQSVNIYNSELSSTNPVASSVEIAPSTTSRTSRPILPRGQPIANLAKRPGVQDKKKILKLKPEKLSAWVHVLKMFIPKHNVWSQDSVYMQILESTQSFPKCQMPPNRWVKGRDGMPRQWLFNSRSLNFFNNSSLRINIPYFIANLGFVR